MELSDKALRMSRVGMNHEHKHKWPVEKRIEVVTKTLALGNMRLVSELTGVSYQLIREWKQEPWWPEIVAEIRASRTSALDTKLSKLVDKSLETVADRLEYGNLFMNKKGELERKPLSALEANKIANDMLTQETNVQKREVALTEGMQVQSMADTIRMLAEQFAQFNTKRTITVSDVTDVEDNSALHDERSPGLQKTVRELRLEAEEYSQESGGQQGPLNDGETGESSQGGWERRGSYQAAEQGWIDGIQEPESSDGTSESIIPA